MTSTTRKHRLLLQKRLEYLQMANSTHLHTQILVHIITTGFVEKSKTANDLRSIISDGSSTSSLST